MLWNGKLHVIKLSLNFTIAFFVLLTIDTTNYLGPLKENLNV